MSEWLYGHHAVEAALTHNRRKVMEIHMVAKHQDRYKKLLSKKKGVKLVICNPKELDHKFPDAVHQGVALQVGTLIQPCLEDILPDAKLLLLLDQVTDPHNLGACLRSADAFGCDAVIVPGKHSASLTAVVAKAAVGAIETVPLIDAGNLNRAIEMMQAEGFWIVGLDGHTDQALKDIDLSGKIALVMGAEGKGLRDLVKKNCDYLAKIPMSGTMESLNVSVSTGISLYEVSRQRDC